MSDTPESSKTVRPDYLIQAKSGSITETLTGFVTAPFRRRQPVSSCLRGHRLLSTISKITLKDIQGATRCGGGGFGTVWVLNLPSKGKVALKQLRVSGGQGDDDLLRRTIREGNTWQDLNHPWVLPFLGIIETPTDLYLISPHADNGSLDDYLRKHPGADRGKFLWQTAGAITHLHKCGIVHGDIKSSNILVSDSVNALLCDFGLARPETTETSAGQQGVGTIRFQSPELLHECRGKTPASDTWAFGMTIYEVLSGNIPFYNYATPKMIDAVANKDERPPKSPSHSPLGLSYEHIWTVAEDCWEKDPAARLTMQGAFTRLRPRHTLVLRGHTEDVNSVAFSLDGRTIVSGSDDRTVRLWDVESASQRGEALKGHTDCVKSVAFSPDGRTVCSGSADFTVRFWDVKSATQRGPALRGHAGFVNSVAFSSDGNTVVSGSSEGTIRLWDVESASAIGWVLPYNAGYVNSVAFSPDGKTIVSGSSEGIIRLWDVESASPRGRGLWGHTRWIRSVAFSPDGKTVISGSEDDTIRLWDVESGGQRGDALKSSVPSVAFSPDGSTIVSGSGRTVQLWDVESAGPLGGPLKGHTSIVTSVAFSPDGMTVISGSWDQTIRIWNIGSSTIDF